MMAGGADAKIIAVTASAMDENRQELMDIGADDFISKPFRESELLQKIHTHVGVEYVYDEHLSLLAEEKIAELTPESLPALPRGLIAGIPVIFISALTGQLDKVRAFAIGGVEYITKPFQMEELHARVETHLTIRNLQIELEQSNARLARANDRMSRDLRAAAKIQETFLPPASPHFLGTEFAWVYRPCDELAGDGLNVFSLGDGSVGFYVLDVSGHGVASALLSVTLSRLLSPPSDPSSILVR
jgi:CheY-like chemotaxis protein